MIWASDFCYQLALLATTIAAGPVEFPLHWPCWPVDHFSQFSGLEKQDQCQSTTTADCTSLQFYLDFVYLALPGCVKLLLNDAHYKSDCILLAIFWETLNKSYFKLHAYVPTLPRLLVLHKTLQCYLWNIVNITEIQACCSAPWCVCCTSDVGIALTTSRGTGQVAHVSLTAKSYHFVLIFSYLYRCIVSYTKYHDPPIYQCIVSSLGGTGLRPQYRLVRMSTDSLVKCCQVMLWILAL